MVSGIPLVLGIFSAGHGSSCSFGSLIPTKSHDDLPEADEEEAEEHERDARPALAPPSPEAARATPCPEGRGGYMIWVGECVFTI